MVNQTSRLVESVTKVLVAGGKLSLAEQEINRKKLSDLDRQKLAALSSRRVKIERWFNLEQLKGPNPGVLHDYHQGLIKLKNLNDKHLLQNAEAVAANFMHRTSSRKLEQGNGTGRSIRLSRRSITIEQTIGKTFEDLQHVQKLGLAGGLGLKAIMSFVSRYAVALDDEEQILSAYRYANEGIGNQVHSAVIEKNLATLATHHGPSYRKFGKPSNC